MENFMKASRIWKPHKMTIPNVILSHLALLPVGVAVLMHPALALESLPENSLRQVSGQDGIAITADMSSASVESLTWQDGTSGRVVLGGAGTPITINPTTAGGKVATTANVQVGSKDSKAGINASLGLGSAVINIPKLSVCSATGTACTSLGALAITNSGTQTQFTLITSDGLFNKDATATLKAVIDNVTVGFGQTQAGVLNQLKLGNMYANMTADGKLYIDDIEGLRFVGTVNFDEKAFGTVKHQGLELLVQHQTDTSVAIDETTGKGLVTLGKIALTGRMTGVDVMVRGVSGTATNLGFNNGTNGIAMRASADFDTNMKLQFGGDIPTGATTVEDGMYLTGWQKTNNNAKSFDTGDTYLNVVAGGGNVTLPTNAALTSAGLAQSTDFDMSTSTVSGGSSAAAYSLGINVRDMSLQGYATDTVFFKVGANGVLSKDGVNDASTPEIQHWAIAPLLHQVNANALVFSKNLNATNAKSGFTQAGDAIGYKVVASTKGSNGTGFNHAGATNTTGLLLTHDDATATSKTRYLGMRHIDSLIKANGELQVNDAGIALTAKDFLFAFRGELATGIMPTGTATFDSQYDRLLVVQGAVKGNVYALIMAKEQYKDTNGDVKYREPQGLQIKALVELANSTGQNSHISLVGAEGKGAVVLNDITGTIAINKANINTTTVGTKGALNIKADVSLNPNNDIAQDVRVKNIVYNTTGTNGVFDATNNVRLGEVALTRHNMFVNASVRGAE